MSGVGYVDAATLASIAEIANDIKSSVVRRLSVRPGHRVLDVGCGPGLDTTRLAPYVVPSGYVVGIDHDSRMVAEATSCAQRANHLRAVAHLVADALSFPFLNSVFDRCRCERLLQHVHDPRQVVAELFRVTKSDGVVVVADTDWASLSVDCEDSEIERRIASAVSDCFADGYAGRQLVRLMTEAGFKVSNIDVHPLYWTSYKLFEATSFPAAGIVTHLISSGRLASSDWHHFVSLLEQADSKSAFFASASVIVVSGSKKHANTSW